MADYIYSNLPVHARHVPDQTQEVDSNGIRQNVELPGYVEIGVDIDGHFLVIARKATAGLLADINRAKQNASSPGNGG